MLFYFTGTGNSLHVAKQLEKEPLSIPQVMQGDTFDFSAEQIGIAAPIYGHEVPPMVKDFLRKARFHTDYFFMVLTYGNRHGGAAELACQLCEECGIQPQYINVVLMVDNWLPGFDMNEQMQMDKKLDEQVSKIAADIQNRREMISPVTVADRAAHAEFRLLKDGLLRRGDTLVVKSLDRLSRSKEDIKQELEFFKANGIRLKVIDLPTTMADFPEGQEWVQDMINNILIEVLSTMAEQERLTTRRRQAEGIAAAKSRGAYLGRPRAQKPANWDDVIAQWRAGKITATEAIRRTGMKRTTFYKLVGR